MEYMRKQYVQCKTRSQALRQCPWSGVIIKQESGYLCLECVIEAAKLYKLKKYNFIDPRGWILYNCY